MRHIALGNMRMHCEDEGQGQAVLLIHGSFTRGDESFSGLLPLLAARFRVICPDLRGHGRTRCPSLDWDEPQLAQDMLDLLDTLRIARAHLVGHSMGGDVAMSCAVSAPERCLTLISIGSAGLPGGPGLARYLDKLNPEKTRRAEHSPFFAHQAELHREAHGGNWRHFFRTTIASCMQYPNFSPADLARLTMPFLLLYGTEDALVPPEDVAHLAAHCPHFVSHALAGAGHSPQNSPRFLPETARLILDFLAQNEPDR